MVPNYFSLTGDLHKKLHYFETLHHVNIKVATSRHKRSTDNSKIDVKDVSFNAFGRYLNILNVNMNN